MTSRSAPGHPEASICGWCIACELMAIAEASRIHNDLLQRRSTTPAHDDYVERRPQAGGHPNSSRQYLANAARPHLAATDYRVASDQLRWCFAAQPMPLAYQTPKMGPPLDEHSDQRRRTIRACMMRQARHRDRWCRRKPPHARYNACYFDEITRRSSAQMAILRTSPTFGCRPNGKRSSIVNCSPLTSSRSRVAPP